MAEAGSLGGGVVDLAQALDGGAGVGGGHEVYGQVGAFGGGEEPLVPGGRAGRRPRPRLGRRFCRGFWRGGLPARGMPGGLWRRRAGGWPTTAWCTWGCGSCGGGLRRGGRGSRPKGEVHGEAHLAVGVPAPLRDTGYARDLVASGGPGRAGGGAEPQAPSRAGGAPLRG